MTTYTLQHPEKGEISYRDNKRYLWMISTLYPVYPLFGVALYLQWQLEWLLFLPLLFIYTLLPLIDWLIGRDNNNPPEEIVTQLQADTYYKWLTVVTVPMHFLVLLVMAWFVASYEISWPSIIACAAMAGIYNGFAINTAHEMGHKNTLLEKRLALVALAVPAYGHFCVEHNAGHHKDVSTPEDPASARMGESIYAFARREIPGCFRRGVEAEKKRLARSGQSFWSINNHILQSYTLSLLLQGGLVVVFGWVMLPFLLVHNVLAWFQLTSANYIEHYGLLREKRENGRYERCQPHHSWNANFIATNLMLFHLQRHSDHHANPSRRYQSLRNFEDIPELPNGYFGMFMLAYIPPLWFKIMDPMLLALPHIQGDLSKINIAPEKRADIEARYGSNPS
jgi:alkane 1-monooxygenase